MKKIILTIFSFLAIWLMLVAAGYAIGIWAFDSPFTEFAKHMTRNGRGTYGIVTSKEPENHGAINYSYSVKGNEYSGMGHGGDDNPRFDDLKLGDRVIIYYDADDPSKSIMGNPWYQVQRDNTGVWTVMLVFPIFPMCVIAAVCFGVRAARRSSRLG